MKEYDRIIDIAKEPLTQEEINNAINFAIRIKRSIYIDIIINKVSEYCKIPVCEITARKRDRHLLEPRQIIHVLCRLCTNEYLKKIGELTGGYDHSTVIYSTKKVYELLNIDSAYNDKWLPVISVFNKTIEDIEKILYKTS